MAQHNWAQHVQHGCADDKYMEQVHHACKLLSESTRTCIKISEVTSPPGAYVLEELFRDCLQAQEDDRLSAVEALSVLNELIAEVQLCKDHPVASSNSGPSQPSSEWLRQTRRRLDESSTTSPEICLSEQQYERWRQRPQISLQPLDRCTVADGLGLVDGRQLESDVMSHIEDLTVGPEDLADAGVRMMSGEAVYPDDGELWLQFL